MNEPGIAEDLPGALKRHTWPLHRTAERSGLVRELLNRRLRAAPYHRFLRNLLPVYEALEEGLASAGTVPALAALQVPPLGRSAALVADLDTLAGPGWAQRLPVLEEGRVYAERVRETAVRCPERLLAHAYVRYLGDLNGGQILARLVAEQLELQGGAGVAFYDFGAVGTPRDLVERLREGLRQAGRHLLDPAGILQEAEEAFRLNIRLSEAVLSSGPEPQASSVP